MNRRRILATTGFAFSAPFAGCLDDLTAGPGSGDAITPSTAIPPGSIDTNCGPADRPLTTRLDNEPGDDESRSQYCYSGAEPSVAIENERAETLTVTVDIGGEDFAETYTLDPGQFIVEQRAFEATQGVTATVTVGDEDETVRWPERSCYQHGIALTPIGIEIGWVDPLTGQADTQHDCYPGDVATLKVLNKGQRRTIEATIRDRCTEGTRIETLDLDAEGSETFRDAILSGGKYDITINVDGGGSRSYDFNAQCWGVNTVISQGGGITMRQVPMF